MAFVPIEGGLVLEVARFAFVPAARAVVADGDVDWTPPSLARGPLFAVQPDDVVHGIGPSDDRISDPRIEGAGR